MLAPENGRRNWSRFVWIVGAALTLVWLVIYLSTVSPGVNFIDSGELITAAHEPGIAHPPGYPLYILMGFVASHLLWGEVAWRVNVLSAFWGAMAVGAMYFLVLELSRYIGVSAKANTKSSAKGRVVSKTPARKGKKSTAQASRPTPYATENVVSSNSAYQWVQLGVAVASASLLGASSTFWSRTAQAKMYTLHFFFVSLLLLMALEWRWAYERGDRRAAGRWLVALALGVGISLTNHLMTMLLVPSIAVLLLVGRDVGARVAAIMRRWPVLLPALLLPLLLYLYLPIRASQGPLMDWGTPDTWGDFWRHVGGWQYRAYLFQNADKNAELIRGYITEQWGLLTWVVLALAFVAGALLARVKPAIFAATLLTAVITIFFALAYGISEIEPYIVPFYMMLVIWLGSAPASLLRLLGVERRERGAVTNKQLSQASMYGAALLGVLALGSAVLQYPQQNHSNDHLAEQFDMNVFNSLPQNSILLTDYWDFYSPTYYLQDVLHVRPDLAIVDRTSLHYPWYLQQLAKKYPWLIEKSRDIADRFSTEQRKWVNGEPYDNRLLSSSYFDLLTSFVDRNYDKHPAYILFVIGCDPSQPPQNCENNMIAPKYAREPMGLVTKLWREPPSSPEVPPVPQYDLQGVTHDKVPMDDFARTNASFYASAYTTLGQLYDALNQPGKASQARDKAQEVQLALQGR